MLVNNNNRHAASCSNASAGCGSGSTSPPTARGNHYASVNITQRGGGGLQPLCSPQTPAASVTALEELAADVCTSLLPRDTDSCSRLVVDVPFCDDDENH